MPGLEDNENGSLRGNFSLVARTLLSLSLAPSLESIFLEKPLLYTAGYLFHRLSIYHQDASTLSTWINIGGLKLHLSREREIKSRTYGIIVVRLDRYEIWIVARRQVE